MRRWEPNASGRLQEAALELYSERGFEQTTVAEIAARAGLTERTFFRYFADKREVLFFGAQELNELVAREVAEAPASASPMDAVAAGLEGAAGAFEGRRRSARRRQAVIDANPELQERERTKMAKLADAMASALRDRGVGDPGASLAAQAGAAVFQVAFARWIDETDQRDLPELMRASLQELKALAAGGQASAAASPGR